MAGTFGVGRSSLPVNDVVIASGDYKAADPAPAGGPGLGATGLTVLVNVSLISGAGATVTVNIEGFDEASQTWYSIGPATPLAITATGMAVIHVDPRIVAGTNNGAHTVPAKWRVRPVGSGTRTTLSYSVGAALTV